MFEVTQNYLKFKLIKSKSCKVQASRILITTYCTSHSNSLSNCGNKMILMKKQTGKNSGGGGEGGFAYERGGDARRKF